MRTRLFIPGWGGSGPDHWQTRWQAQLRGARRVELPAVFAPERDPWIEAIDRAVVRALAQTGQPPVLIAHSLGCIAVAAWAEGHARPIAGAMLVAPPDCEHASATAALRGFAPMPRSPLRFPTLVVTSDDDPYIEAARAVALAADWGAEFEVVPGAGHINAASGHGDWPEGLALLRQLVSQRAA
ncbi:MAG: alpha/beta hydrolase [Myxococcales bacterium]|nr:alpha/beta hydrolase [Myxococcales bacterium]